MLRRRNLAALIAAEVQREALAASHLIKCIRQVTFETKSAHIYHGEIFFFFSLIKETMILQYVC